MINCFAKNMNLQNNLLLLVNVNSFLLGKYFQNRYEHE